MASKIVYLVYQDAPLCGARCNWGLEQTKVAQAEGLEIVKIPFTHASEQINAKELILRAAKAGMHLPFFTDGEKFSQNVADFAEAKPEPKKRTKKSQKKDE